MDAIALKKKMLEHGDTGRKLAKSLGITESTLSCKLHERNAAFRKCEISKIIRRYNLTCEEIQEIFF